MPFYISHRIYTKKKEEAGSKDNILKFWCLNAVLGITDVLEALVLSLTDDDDTTYYLLYLICKAAGFVALFFNSCRYAGLLYDALIPPSLGLLEGYIDFIVEQIQHGFSFLANQLSPALLQSLLGRVSSVLFLLGAKLLATLEFKAAGTESSQATSDSGALNRSFCADKPDAANAQATLNKTFSVPVVSENPDLMDHPAPLPSPRPFGPI